MPAHVAYGKAVDFNGPIMAAAPSGAELVGDGATGSVTAQAGDVALVTATSDVYIAFGTAPTASAATHFLASGQVMAYGSLQTGWKMAVVAVA